jgi:hypothetical protein
MNLNYTFKNFISFDDVVLASTLGTRSLTPEGVATQYALWDSDTLKDALDTVTLLLDSGAEFKQENVIKMVEYYYERTNDI